MREVFVFVKKNDPEAEVKLQKAEKGVRGKGRQSCSPLSPVEAARAPEFLNDKGGFAKMRSQAYDVVDVRRRLTFLSAVFATAIMMFAAQSLEYQGLEYMTWAGALAIAAIVGSVCFAVLAARMFRHVSALEMVLVSCSIAGLPFLIEWLLRLNGTQLNVHGFAILGFFVYGLGSELLAIALMIAVVVRALMDLKRRRATDTGIPA